MSKRIDIREGIGGFNVNILNPRFSYINSSKTSVAETFKRFGFKPTTDAERKARQDKLHEEKIIPIRERK